jgi:hypothetical protein
MWSIAARMAANFPTHFGKFAQQLGHLSADDF